MEKKYGLFGTILSISILLTLTILGPNAVAGTPVYGGDLLSQVQNTIPPTLVAQANAGPGGSVSLTPGGNPVVVTTDWTIDKQVSGVGFHGFYLRVTNLDVTPQEEMDEDELWIGCPGGPVYQTGYLEADVDGSVGDRIEIYIYVNVTFGGGFEEDEKIWTITLTP